MTRVPEIDGVAQLAAGYDFTCARLEDGRVGCWGGQRQGRIGVPDVSDAFLPVFPNVSDVVDLAADEDNVCALTAGGQVWCWGAPGSVGLIEDVNTLTVLPTEVPGIDTAVDVATGTGSGLALLENGDVMAWGWSPMDGERHATPVLIAQGAERIFAGGSDACLVEIGQSQPLCSGSNLYGALGVGGEERLVGELTPLLGLDSVQKVSFEWFAGCALSIGDVWCWGDGPVALEPTGADVFEPQRVGLSNVIDVGASYHHACAIVEGEPTPYCWGDNSRGALGRPTDQDQEPLNPVGPVDLSL